MEESIKRQEALLRSILAHQIAFNQNISILLGSSDEAAKAYSEQYQKTVKEAISFHLNEAGSETRHQS
jgi:hypothetical protein